MITISPSQLKTYADCPRKWGLYKLDRVREERPPRVAKDGTPLPDKPDFGSAVHKELEDWAEGRNDFSPNEAGAAASKLSKIAMPPGVGVSEGEFQLVVGELPDGTPVAISGICDRRAGPGEWDDHPTAIADDYKTTGDYKWALTPELMAKDPQVLAYVVYVASKYGVSRVLARWLYVRLDWKRDGNLPAAKSVRAVKRLMDLTDPDLREEWDKVVALVMELAAKVHAGESAGQQQQNTLSCMKFGGCGYRGNQCDPSSGDVLAAYITQWRKRDRGVDPGSTLVTLNSNKEQDVNILDMVDNIAKKNGNGAEAPPPAEDKPKPRKVPKAKVPQPKKPKKDKVEAKLPQINTPETAADVQPEPAKVVGTPGAATPESVAPGPQLAGHLLYIDCAPMKGAVATPLADIVAPLKEQLKGDGVHWAISQGEHFVDRRAKLQAMLEAFLRSTTAMAITCRSNDEDGQMLLGVLTSHATMVVGGLG